MKYPTLDEVEKASLEQLTFWYAKLPPPGYNWQHKSHEEFKAKSMIEIKILTRITEKLAKLGKKFCITKELPKNYFTKIAQLEELD